VYYHTHKYTYELVERWQKETGGGPLNDVCGLAIDEFDRLYVFNRSGHPLRVFDPEGNLVTSWGEGLFRRGHGACIGPDGPIYCTDDRDHIVHKFGPEGKLLMTLGKKGQPSDTGYVEKRDYFERLATVERSGPPFNRPTGVAVSLSGFIYVADGYGNARVHKFTPDGELIFSWGEPGGGLGQFRCPHSIWVDREDRLWVADRENHRIQIFGEQGEFVDQWIDLVRPTDIFIDAEDTVYVTELCRRLSIFTIDGKLLARWGNTKEEDDPETALFVAPHAVAVDSRGDIYVGEVAKTYAGVDRGTKVIRKFVRRA
jgi:hypothetical protein